MARRSALLFLLASLVPSVCLGAGLAVRGSAPEPATEVNEKTCLVSRDKTVPSQEPKLEFCTEYTASACCSPREDAAIKEDVQQTWQSILGHCPGCLENMVRMRGRSCHISFPPSLSSRCLLWPPACICSASVAGSRLAKQHPVNVTDSVNVYLWHGLGVDSRMRRGIWLLRLSPVLSLAVLTTAPTVIAAVALQHQMCARRVEEDVGTEAGRLGRGHREPVSDVPAVLPLLVPELYQYVAALAVPQQREPVL